MLYVIHTTGLSYTAFPKTVLMFAFPLQKNIKTKKCFLMIYRKV